MKEPQATFSPCFGGPFLVWHPSKYAELLAAKMKQHNARVWLVNTGWSGGGYGVGKRIKLAYTRAIIDAIHSGALAEREDQDAIRSSASTSSPTAPACRRRSSSPRNTWADKAAYDATAKKLAGLFIENFETYAPGASRRGESRRAEGVTIASALPAGEAGRAHILHSNETDQRFRRHQVGGCSRAARRGTSGPVGSACAPRRAGCPGRAARPRGCGGVHSRGAVFHLEQGHGGQGSARALVTRGRPRGEGAHAARRLRHGSFRRRAARHRQSPNIEVRMFNPIAIRSAPHGRHPRRLPPHQPADAQQVIHRGRTGGDRRRPQYWKRILRGE